LFFTTIKNPNPLTFTGAAIVSFDLVLLLPGDLRLNRCPVCGWETTGSERFCPFDATPLNETGSG